MGKKQKKTKDKKKGVFFRLLCLLCRCFYRKRKVIGDENIPEEPAIIVGNHAQIHGPLAMQLYFHREKQIWCDGRVMDIKEAPSYAYEDFFGYKPKWTRWFYKFVSYLIAPLCVYIFKNADTIGVYRDSRGVATFKNSVQALKGGADVIIFPECHTEYNEIINEFQDRFIDLAKFYYRSTGKEISFVPMYVAPKLKTIVYGKPIKYNHEDEISIQMKQICSFLKDEITRIAKELPVHTVVPYANIPKKKYPKSKEKEMN